MNEESTESVYNKWNLSVVIYDYLMKVIPETGRTHSIRYLRFYSLIENIKG